MKMCLEWTYIYLLLHWIVNNHSILAFAISVAIYFLYSRENNPYLTYKGEGKDYLTIAVYWEQTLPLNEWKKFDTNACADEICFEYLQLLDKGNIVILCNSGKLRA
jgi:hypothetical protein